MLKTIFGGLLIILLFLATLGFVVKQLEKPDFLVEQSRKANLYGRLSTSLPEILPKEMQSDLKPLESAEITEVLRETVNAETFYVFMDEFLSSYLNWLTGTSSELDFNYNLAPLKDKASSQLTQKMLSNYNSLPECLPTQLKGWNAAKEFPVCRLAEGNVKNDDLERIFSEQARSITQSLPDQISAKPSDALEKVRARLSTLNTIILGIWLATGLLIGLFLLIRRQKGFGALASIFIMVGLLQVGFSLIAWDWLGRNVADFVKGQSSPVLIPLIIEITTTILEVLKTILGNLSIIFLGAGVTLLVLAIIARLHRPKTLPTT